MTSFGSWPQLRWFDELLRIIREEEPPKPSLRLSSSDTLPSIAANRQIEPKKLSSLVCGELDWIVMKALEKDRTRRYETANAMAEDVRHYLADEPVDACPPSAGYRFRKFARRHKTLLATAMLVTTVVIVGAGVSIWQSVRATRAWLGEQEARQATQREYERAEANLHLALQAMDEVYLKSIGAEKLLREDAESPDGETMSRRRPEFSELELELLQRGLAFYDRFARQNRENPQALFETGKAFYRVALLQAALDEDDEAYRLRGKVHKSLTNYENARADLKMAVRLDPEDAASHHELAFLLTLAGDAKLRDDKGALRHAKEAARLAPGDPAHHSSLAYMYTRVGDTESAVVEYEKAIELSPLPSAAYGIRVQMYDAALRDYPRVIENANKFLEDDEQPWMLVRRARAYQALGQFDKALELAPRRSYSYKRRAEASFHLGQYGRALADLNKALDFNPNDMSCLTWVDPNLVANCPDRAFREGIFKLADRAVESNDGLGYANWAPPGRIWPSRSS